MKSLFVWTLKAINMFSTVDELMDFVKQTIQSDPKELPDSLSDDKSKYQAFLKLPINDGMLGPQELVALIYEVYNTLQKIPKIDALFKSRMDRRFLMHLIGQHIQIVQNNSVQGCVTIHGQMVTCYHHIPLMEKYFQHSCAPNVISCEGEGNHVFITVRPIKKGERLSYPYCMFLLEPKEKRQQILWERKKMVCHCSRCLGITASSAQQIQLASDQNFEDIALGFSPTVVNDPIKSEEFAKKCVTFLKKWDQIPWCDAIGTVMTAYIYLLLRNKPLTLPTN